MAITGARLRAVAALWAALCTCPTPPSTAHADPTQADCPNILLIIADDLGLENLGAYTTGPDAVPGDPPPTPTLDALATSGILFRNAWVTPICSPTRACLYTGRYGFRTGVRDKIPANGQPLLNPPLDPTETTFPELLQPAGYANALFGKWHLGVYDEVGGMDAPRVAGWNHYAGAPRGGLSDYYLWEKTTNGITDTVTTYATTENVNDALDWIAQQTPPWTCTLAFNAPHAPFHVPPLDLHGFDLIDDGTAEDDPEHQILRYKAAIQAMDSEIGRLLDAIAPQLANTTVIFIGDNGTPTRTIEAPYVHAKGSVYEGGVHVPLIISGAGVVSPGRQTDALVHGVDIFSTIAELAGVDPVAATAPDVTLDAVSLLPILNDPTALAQRQTIYTERVIDQPVEGAFAVRNSRYKLIRQAGVFEFYDLLNDPLEVGDLLAAGQLTLTQRANLDTLANRLVVLLEIPAGDFDGDGVVNLIDFTIFANCFGRGKPGGGCGPVEFSLTDITDDGITNLADFVVFALNFNG